MSEALYAGAAVGYDELFARATSLFIPSLFRAAHLTRGQNVLDVATGTGVVAQAAAEIIGRSGSVTAGDISPSMLEAARRKLTGLPFDGHDIPHPDKHFHAVICQLGLIVLQRSGPSASLVLSDPSRWWMDSGQRLLRTGALAIRSGRRSDCSPCPRKGREAQSLLLHQRRQLNSPPSNGPLAVEMEVHIGRGRR